MLHAGGNLAADGAKPESPTAGPLYRTFPYGLRNRRDKEIVYTYGKTLSSIRNPYQAVLTGRGSVPLHILARH
jgi:hypothetical protein